MTEQKATQKSAGTEPNNPLFNALLEAAYELAVNVERMTLHDVYTDEAMTRSVSRRGVAKKYATVSVTANVRRKK